MNTTKIRELAQLSQAAYAYFDTENFASYDPSQESARKKLIVEGLGDFSERESISFIDRYEVVHQYREPISGSNGFSATLFRDKQNPTNLIFSCRGTEVPAGVFTDLLFADLRIGVDGYASPQALALYRYIKQLTTPKGQVVEYSEAEMSRLFWLAKGNTAVSQTHAEDYAGFKQNLSGDQGIDAGQPSGVAVIKSGDKVEAAGHSLGGHLAMLADRLFPGQFSKPQGQRHLAS